MKTFDMHPDAIFSVAWNFLGTHIVTACKDKKVTAAPITFSQTHRAC